MEIITINDNYLCSNCCIAFDTEKEHKEHYKTDFHRYNIKRRLIELPPTTLEQFSQRKNQQFSESKKPDNASSSIAILKCIPCNKSFQSRSTYEQHISSNKHKESKKAYEQKQKTEDHTQSETSKSNLPPRKTTLDDITICLFCDLKSKDFESSVLHMLQGHGFFFAEEAYLTDKKGLVKYLAEKINIGFMCIECENKGTKDKKSGEAVKTHMVDKGHCFMSTETFEEYMDFYDYSKKIETNNNLIQGAPVVIQESDDSEWEFVEEEEEGEGQEGKSKSKKNKKKEEEQPTYLDDENIDLSTLTREQKQERFLFQRLKIIRSVVRQGQLTHLGELQLPNGKLLGHRQYRVFYHQYHRSLYNAENRMKAILGDGTYEERQIMLAKYENEINALAHYNMVQANRINHRSVIRGVTKFKRVALVQGMRNNNQKHYREQNPK